MEVTLKPICYDEKEILRNLLEKYLYEFSQWDLCDINALGLYGYEYLDNYWTEKNRWAYFILADGRLAGFALANDFAEHPKRKTDFSLAEFFVLHKYRRQGVGKRAFFQMLDRLPGRWQLLYHPKNTAAAQFWRNAVSEYTGGRFELFEGLENKYNDGSPGSVYCFRA